PEIHGTNLRTHNTGRCENKRPVLYACRFHSGSKVHYNIETSNESPVVITREKFKAQEDAVATSPLSQFEEGGEEAKSNGEDPPANDEEESGDKESAVEKSGEQVEDSDPATTPKERSKRWFVQGSGDVYYIGLALNDKGNPNRSIQEEPKIRINSLNEVPEHKRLFEGYNMHWMTKTPGKYSIEMVREFYENYYCTLEKNAPSKNAIKKDLVIDFVRVRAIPVDISERPSLKS
ncbi:hypothetical protein HAX54_014342, partial [Datura stramonium]|nr:hypothetical protein [Datura stramonium]